MYAFPFGFHEDEISASLNQLNGLAGC
jgi:hypothetical protein